MRFAQKAAQLSGVAPFDGRDGGSHARVLADDIAYAPRERCGKWRALAAPAGILRRDIAKRRDAEQSRGFLAFGPPGVVLAGRVLVMDARVDDRDLRVELIERH